MAGVNIGMVAVMAITASDVVSLLLAAPGATPIVTTVAAGYFAFVAYRIATAPPLTENTEFRRQPSFAGGVFLSLVNPKATRVIGGRAPVGLRTLFTSSALKFCTAAAVNAGSASIGPVEAFETPAANAEIR